MLNKWLQLSLVKSRPIIKNRSSLNLLSSRKKFFSYSTRLCDNTKASAAVMTENLFKGSEHSSLYDKFRPVAPSSLIQQINEFYEGDKFEMCVDVGCGTGQFTKLLIPLADKIIGTDVSETQLAQAKANIRDEKVEFRLGAGERIAVDDGSVDLVTISQALHWLKFDEFYDEVNRVLKDGGVLAVIGYHFTRPARELGARGDELYTCLNDLWKSTLPHWTHHRKLVCDGYQDIPRPEMLRDYSRSDDHRTVINASIYDWAGYVSSWSGFQAMRKKDGVEKADQLLDQFKSKCLRILDRENENPSEVVLKMETNYWLILYRK